MILGLILVLMRKIPKLSYSLNYRIKNATLLKRLEVSKVTLNNLSDYTVVNGN